MQPVTVIQAGGTFSGTGWTVAQNYVGSWFLNYVGGTPPSGQTLKLWYNYQIPIIAQANDTNSQSLYNGPNGGIYSEYISDTSLTTFPMAQARAFQQRQEYAFVPERLTFATSPDWMGWIRSGQTFKYTNALIPDVRNSYNWGITNAVFICIQNSIQFIEGGYRVCTLRSIRIS